MNAKLDMTWLLNEIELAEKKNGFYNTSLTQKLNESRLQTLKLVLSKCTVERAGEICPKCGDVNGFYKYHKGCRKCNNKKLVEYRRNLAQEAGFENYYQMLKHKRLNGLMK